MLYPRDPSLDPQLVWKGKDEQDREDLAVPVVPIYIQEKIHPQALIETLPRTSEPGEATSADLFADFNGLRRLRPEGRVLPARAELDEPDDPRRLAAGDDQPAEKEGSRARSRRSTSTRPTASSSAPTGRSAPASAT